MKSAGAPAAASAISPIIKAPVPVEPGPMPQTKTGGRLMAKKFWFSG
jgi:hypothetical protein